MCQLFNFLKRTKTANDVLKAMFEGHLEVNVTLQKQRETWDDERVPFDSYLKEEDCLFLFVVFSAIQQCKLSATEKRILLNLFRQVLSRNVKAGRVDPQIEINLQDYCDAVNAPHPEHLGPLWNVGSAFARHLGADKDIAYVQVGVTGHAKPLLLTVELLNAISRSYRIVEG